MKSTNKNPPLFLFLNEIGIINQLAQAKLERVLPNGLRMSQFILLNHLNRLGGAWSPARLANALQVTKGAITNTVQRLEQRGLVKVEADPDDRRGKLIQLTAAGHKQHQSCLQSITPSLASMAKAFGNNRIAEAIPLLQEVRQFLDKERE